MFLLKMFEGIGDTFYQRHFVKRLAELKPGLTIFTPWPQLFHDIPVGFWYQRSTLRTQDENITKTAKSVFAHVHKKKKPDYVMSYDNRHFTGGMTIPQSLALKISRSLKLDIDDYSLDFPLKSEWVEEALKIKGDGPICLVRPATVRSEWPAPGRNPAAGLIPAIVDRARKNFKVIGVSHTKPPFEVNQEKIKFDVSYEKGELPIEIVAALASVADVVVAPVGFMTPLTVAVKAKAFTIFGGHVHPRHIYDPRMDLNNHHIVYPEPFCNCSDNDHACEKFISVERCLSEFEKCLNSNGTTRPEWATSLWMNTQDQSPPMTKPTLTNMLATPEPTLAEKSTMLV